VQIKKVSQLLETIEVDICILFWQKWWNGSSGCKEESKTSDILCSLNCYKPICWIVLSNMSVLCTSTNGWIISHDNFVRCLYERVEGIPARRFEFDPNFFKINTPFVRSCVNENNSFHDVKCLASPPRKRQKKRENGLVNSDVSKNMYILVGKPIIFQGYSPILEKCPFFFRMDAYIVKLLGSWRIRFRSIKIF
jgi:hypothetical protein